MGAGVGILAGVMENVSTELRGLDKRLAAKLARMRFFTCVGAHMTIQSFFSGKSVMTLKNKHCCKIETSNDKNKEF
jgi:hypothetical protein